MFTVKQLSKLAGVTPRTLHHYDDIGLLKPSRIGDNGYRYYEEEALLRLQQILFYRELDMPLEDIKRIMDNGLKQLVTAVDSKNKLAATWAVVKSGKWEFICKYPYGVVIYSFLRLLNFAMINLKQWQQKDGTNIEKTGIVGAGFVCYA